MKKSKRKKSPIWPYLGILACLFLLSLTAPRAWERQTRKSSSPGSVVARERIASHEEVRTATFDTGPLELSDETELLPREPELELSVLESIAGPIESPVGEPLMPPAPRFADDVCEYEPPDEPEPAWEVALLPSTPESPAADVTPPVEAWESRVETKAELPPAEGPPPSPLLPAEPAAPEVSAPDELGEPQQTAPLLTHWPLPRRLLEQLSDLAHDDAQLIWVRRAIDTIEEIGRTSDPLDRHELLDELADLVAQDAQMPPADARMQSQVTRARYAITRWLDIWTAASELESLSPAELAPLELQTSEVSAQVAAVRKHSERDQVGRAWREFLMLDELQPLLASTASDQQRREVARRVLARMQSPRLTAAQRRFLASTAITPFRAALEPWAAAPIDVRETLGHLEQYEYSSRTSDAHAVVDDYRSLKWARPAAAATLARHLDTHYRNANLRVAVSSELANRVLPQPERVDAPVRDTVVNVPVRGHSSTFTQLRLQMVPDSRRIRLGLEAHGTVDANTISSAGPATFRNRGQSTFLVRKLFVLGPRGLLVWPAIAEAENNFNYLVSLETDYDGVPLVGSLVRNIARSQHDEKSGQARRQTEQKVAIRALHQFDSEVDARLAEAETRMQREQGATLERLGLELVPIALSTTETRATARLRLASSDQLGAHTPRPRAPSDSWFSLQLHQSALNNALTQLDLEGRTFELPELFAWLAEKLGRADLVEQEDLPEDVRITFAAHDAVRLECVDDRIEVNFAIAELRHEGSRWRDFQVRTHYAPEAEGLSPKFTRVDTIHLDGASMRGKIEFKLRAIFSKVLSKNRDLRLLAATVTDDPRFRDLQVTQFEVADGWIGLAYSPRRVQSKMARRPQ